MNDGELCVDDGELCGDDGELCGDDGGNIVEAVRPISFCDVADGDAVRDGPLFDDRDAPLENDGDDLPDGATDGVSDFPERASATDDGCETTAGEGALAVVIASAASAASAEARRPVRSSLRDEIGGVVAGCDPPSPAVLVVRASSRRRKDSAAAAPAPVMTVDRGDGASVAPWVGVGPVPLAEVGVDANRNARRVEAEVCL